MFSRASSRTDSTPDYAVYLEALAGTPTKFVVAACEELGHTYNGFGWPTATDIYAVCCRLQKREFDKKSQTDQRQYLTDRSKTAMPPDEVKKLVADMKHASGYPDAD